jgi:hypothetical protein
VTTSMRRVPDPRIAKPLMLRPLYRGSEPSSSDDDESGLSDSDPELGSDCDSDGFSSEDELGRSGSRMNIQWDPIDEQRLQAYKKEGKSWKWIFRTQPAVRTRLNIVGQRQVGFLARVDRRLLVRACPLTSG